MFKLRRGKPDQLTVLETIVDYSKRVDTIVTEIRVISNQIQESITDLHSKGIVHDKQLAMISAELRGLKQELGTMAERVDEVAKGILEPPDDHTVRE